MSNLSNAIFKTLLEHAQNPTLLIKVGSTLNITDNNKAFSILVNGKSINDVDELLINPDKEVFIKSVKKCIESNKVIKVSLRPFSFSSHKQLWNIEFLPVGTYSKDDQYAIVIINQNETQDNEAIIQIKALNNSLIESNQNLLSTKKDLEITLTKLSESEARFRSFFDKAPLSMCVLKGPELITEYANEDILKLWGRTKEEVIGIPQEIARPEIKIGPQNEALKTVKNIFKTGQPLSINALKAATLTKNGYFNAMYQPIKNDKNAVISILAILTDVTEQINYREELKKAKDILKLAMDASEMGSWNVDLQNKRLHFSDRAQRIYGINDVALTIQQAKDMVVEEYLEYLTTSIKRALHNKRAFNIEYQIHPQGSSEIKWLRSTGIAYYDREGKALYIAGAVLDITEYKQDEIRKNDFIGMVSHELKTPLTSLTAYIQLLQYKLNESDTNFTKETLNKVSVQLKRMSAMIDGFLNVSILESGKLQLNKTTFDLVELLNSIAEENGLVLPTHFIQVIGLEKIYVNADKEKISNVINNLISNAAKYSKKDSLIAIKCEEFENEVIVSVEDEGMGIHSNDFSKVFNRFFRVENPNTKTIAGFGVGLYICSEIINRHNGKIWVESEVNKGSTFYFSLPTNQ